MTSAKDLTIAEMAPYIEGKKFLESKGTFEKRCDRETFEKFVKDINTLPTAAQMIQAIVSHTVFFECFEDLAVIYPKNLWCDLFYTAKNGVYYDNVPGILVDAVMQSYEKYKCCNLIVKTIPIGVLNNAFTEGYLTNGVTLSDVIRTLCHFNYMPLTNTKRKVKYTQHSEVYMKDSDMVLCIPTGPMNEALTLNVIEELTEFDNDVFFRGTPIRTMFGYYGASNSKYDLRNII